jgi:CheY-like chemotaxis protein
LFNEGSAEETMMEKIRILVVEDEAITAHDLRTSLLQLGYEVPAIVSTGEDAIRSAGETHPDLILMDIILGGRMSGIEAAEVIRQSTAIPVIFVTAADDISTITQAKRVEPYGYITKPYQISLLQSTIETALYKHTMDSRLRESEEWRRTILQTAMDGFWMGAHTGGQ